MLSTYSGVVEKVRSRLFRCSYSISYEFRNKSEDPSVVGGYQLLHKTAVLLLRWHRFCFLGLDDVAVHWALFPVTWFSFDRGLHRINSYRHLNAPGRTRNDRPVSMLVQTWSISRTLCGVVIRNRPSNYSRNKKKG